MSRLLIKLRHAPDDEIQEIRSLLQAHRIDFYETQSGPWGISAPGIWLKDEQQYDRAKALMDDYQENRFREKRAEYEEQRRLGQHRTFLQNLLAGIHIVMRALGVGRCMIGVEDNKPEAVLALRQVVDRLPAILREGIERFFISDINNAAASNLAQSELAVMWDQFTSWSEGGGASGGINFNHIPGGCNVMFMDGHVEFIKYPGEWPVSAASGAMAMPPPSHPLARPSRQSRSRLLRLLG